MSSCIKATSLTAPDKRNGLGRGDDDVLNKAIQGGAGWLTTEEEVAR